MKAETNEVTTEINIKLFTPHANFDDAINRAICQSDIEGGVALDALPLGTVLHVQTMNHLYRLSIFQSKNDPETVFGFQYSVILKRIWRK